MESWIVLVIAGALVLALALGPQKLLGIRLRVPPWAAAGVAGFALGLCTAYFSLRTPPASDPARSSAQPKPAGEGQPLPRTLQPGDPLPRLSHWLNGPLAEGERAVLVLDVWDDT